MNNKQVAHLWANKSRQQASGSHFFFDGDTIYSYGAHFPIARHYKGNVLFTAKDYSVTTQRHKSYVRQACNHIPTFTVGNVMASPGRADVQRYAAELETLATKLARARDPQWLLRSLERATDEANRFCETFGFKARFSMPDEATLASLKEKSRQAAIKKAKATQERNARIEKENETAIVEWILGKRDSLPYSINKVFLREITRTENGSDGLKTTHIMQTIKGATVPLEDARKAFRFVMAKREKGWHRNGDTFAVGEFQLDAVNDFGVVAGCHRVAWDEIERFAKLQGWL